MNWRFTIIDRSAVSHEILEPVGWDAIEIDIVRDESTHGIVFDFQGKDMKYYGDGMSLLKAEYDTYGSQGIMTLLIEQSCDDTLTELYRGAFVFSQYVYTSGDECFVKIPIETTSDVMDLTTKWDQAVDLSATVAFDGTTPLDSYSKLDFDLMLPSKGIVLTDKSIKNVQTVETVSNELDSVDVGGGTNQKTMTVELALDDISAEIGNYGFSPSTTIVSNLSVGGIGIIHAPAPAVGNTQQLWNGSSYVTVSTTNRSAYRPVNIDDLGIVVNYQDTTANYGVALSSGNLSFQIDGEIEPLNSTVMGIINLYLLRRAKDGTLDWLSVQQIVEDDYIYIGVSKTYKKVKFSLSYSNAAFVLNEGDEIFLFINSFVGSSLTDIDAGNNTFKMTIEPTSFFKLTFLSKTPPSTTKACLINEVISRISEAVTNNKIKAYSEYFGRTDSQPYSVSSNGIGSMEALAKGIYIRNQQNRVAGQPSIFSLSMKDVFEGVEPIHHIGFGIEDDPSRTGYKRLRVENWKHFYTDTGTSADIIMNCIGVKNIERKIIEAKNYSTFQFGYEKYEAEQYNGLDEFLTKRIYRTTLNGLKNELNKISKFIASGYAWEITRRKNTDSSDWRFDNDTFIVCLRDYIILKQGTTIVSMDSIGNAIELADASFVGIAPLAVGDVITITNSVNNTSSYTITTIGYDGTVSLTGGYEVRVLVAETLVDEYIEAGTYIIKRTNGYFVETGNVDTPTNLVDPDTTYNFRISPIRNAMRWMDKIAQGYKSNPTIIFTSGTGNYQASGKMLDSFGRIENAVISEMDSIVSSLFANAGDISPFLAAEQLTFDFPMSVADFRAILANPYGKIYWENQYESGYAYISTVKYQPEEGIANFVLIPKI